MVVEKSDLVEKLTNDQLAEFERLGKMIDAKLTEEYYGERVVISLEKYPHPKVLMHLVKIYMRAGWTIKFDSDQRDGSWIEIS